MTVEQLIAKLRELPSAAEARIEAYDAGDSQAAYGPDGHIQGVSQSGPNVVIIHNRLQD